MSTKRSPKKLKPMPAASTLSKTSISQLSQFNQYLTKFSKKKFLVLNKQRQRLVFYFTLSFLIILLLSVLGIVLWEVEIGVKLYYFQYIFGLYATITLPVSVGMSMLFFILLPTLFTIKSLLDIRVVKSENRAIRFIWLSIWLFFITAIFGMGHVGIKLFEVYDINQRLNLTLLRLSYLYARDDKKAVIALNELHQEYVCCGSEDVRSWLEILNWNPSAALAVPHSCCRPDYPGPCYYEGMQGNYSRTEVIKSVYLRGCRKVLNRYFRNTVRPVFYLLIAIFLLELFIVFLLLIFIQNFDIETFPKKKVQKRPKLGWPSNKQRVPKNKAPFSGASKIKTSSPSSKKHPASSKKSMPKKSTMINRSNTM